MVDISSLEITSAVTALANAACSGLAVSEIALLASLFVQLGDTMATIATVRGLNGEPSEAQKEEHG